MIINRNLNYSFLYNIANAVFPVATLPFVFRAITPQTYGSIVYSNLIYQVLIALFFNSLISFSIREYQKNKLESVDYIYSLQIFFTVISAFLYAILSFFFKFTFDLDNNYIDAFIISTCFLFINSDWILFSEQDYKKLFYRTLLIKSVLLISVYVFVTDDQDDLLYAYMLSISYISNNLLAYYYVRKCYGVRIKFSLRKIKATISQARYFLSSASIGVSYQYVDQLIVGVLLNSSSLAYLNILKQITGMLSIVPNTICRFYLPKASLVYLNKDNIKNYHKSLSVKYISVIISSSVLLFILGQYGLQLFVGENFDISKESITICILLYIISALSVYLDTQHSIPLHYEKVTFSANVIVASFYLISLYWVATNYNYNGVLFSLAVAELLGVVYVCVFYLRRKEVWLK